MTKLIRYTILSLFFFIPLTFSFKNFELFEFPKIILIYSFTSILLIQHILNHLLNNTPLFTKNRLSLIFLIFLFSQILSTIFSIDRHMSFFGYYSRFNGGLLSIICYFILFQILSVYIDKDFTQKIINTSIISAFFVCLYAILQHFGIDKNLWVQDVQNRVFSTLGQPNWLAAYLSIVICFILFQIDQNPSILNLKSYIIFQICFLSLLFTKSKSGLIAVSIPLSYFFLKTLINKKYHQLIVLSLLIFIPILIFDNPIKDKLFPKILKIEDSIIEDYYNITASQDIRKIVWQGALNLWKKFPILGSGLETFAISYYWVRPISHNLTSEWDFLYNKAHNEYLNYAATTGSVGLISYLLLIVFSLLSLKTQPYLLLAYLTILITNFAGFSVVVTSLYFFLIPAFTLGKYKKTSQTPSSKSIKILLNILLIIPLYFLYFSVKYFLADRHYFLSNQYLKKYPQNSLVEISKSVKLLPGNPEYQIQYAQILSSIALSSNDNTYSQKALDALVKAEEISPFHPNYLKKSAQILFNLGQTKTAIDLIKKTSLLAPTDAKTFYILATFYTSTDQINLAKTAYQKALDLKSNYDHAHMGLAQIYLIEKDYQSSLDHFQSAYDINPKNTDALEKIKELKLILTNQTKSS